MPPPPPQPPPQRRAGVGMQSYSAEEVSNGLLVGIVAADSECDKNVDLGKLVTVLMRADDATLQERGGRGPLRDLPDQLRFVKFREGWSCPPPKLKIGAKAAPGELGEVETGKNSTLPLEELPGERGDEEEDEENGRTRGSSFHTSLHGREGTGNSHLSKGESVSMPISSAVENAGNHLPVQSPPRGILKAEWLRKHILELPVALLLVAELNLELTRGEHQSRALALEAEVRRIAGELRVRNIEIVLALVHHGTPRALGANAQDMVDPLVADLRQRNLGGGGISTISVSPHDLVPRKTGRGEVIFAASVKEIAARLRRGALNHLQMRISLQRQLLSSHYSSPGKTELSLDRQPWIHARRTFKLGVFLEATGDIDQSSQYFRECLEILGRILTSQRMAAATGGSFDSIGPELNLKFQVHSDLSWQARKVAEMAHLRLLRRIRNPQEAVAHFQSYMSKFAGAALFAGSAVDQPRHRLHAWLSQQYAVFAELTSLFHKGSSSGGGGVSSNFAPATANYWRSASLHAMMRLSAARKANLFTQFRPSHDLPVYLGQLGSPIAENGLVTETEVLDICRHVSTAALDASPIEFTRRRAGLFVHDAQVSLYSGEYERGLHAYAAAATIYLQDGWSKLAAPALSGCVECIRKLDPEQKDKQASYLLQLSALPTQPYASRIEHFGAFLETIYGGNKSGPSVGEANNNYHGHVVTVRLMMPSTIPPLSVTGRFQEATANAGDHATFTLHIQSNLPVDASPTSALLEFSSTFCILLELQGVDGDGKEEARDSDKKCSQKVSLRAQKMIIKAGVTSSITVSFPLPILPQDDEGIGAPGLSLTSATLSFKQDSFPRGEEVQGAIMKSSAVMKVPIEASPPVLSMWKTSCGFGEISIVPTVGRAHVSVKEAHPPLLGFLNKLDITVHWNVPKSSTAGLGVNMFFKENTVLSVQSLFQGDDENQVPLLWVPSSDETGLFEPLRPLNDDLKGITRSSVFGPLVLGNFKSEASDITSSMSSITGECSVWVRGCFPSPTLSFRLLLLEGGVSAAQATASPAAAGNTLQLVSQSVVKAHFEQKPAFREWNSCGVASSSGEVMPCTVGHSTYMQVTLTSLAEEPIKLLRVEVITPDETGGQEGQLPRAQFIEDDYVLFDATEDEDGEPELTTLGKNSSSSYTTGFRVQAPPDVGVLGTVGALHVHWTRARDLPLIATSPPGPMQVTLAAVTKIDLPQLKSSPLPPLEATLQIPHSATFSRELSMEVLLTNRTPLHQVVSVDVNAADDARSSSADPHFVWSGSASSQVHLEPRSSSSLPYRLIPVAVGKLRLPRVRVAWVNTLKEETVLLGAEAEPSYIFVKPTNS